EIGKNAKHPYTQALLGAIFDLKMDFSKKIESIESEAPSPLDVPPGCPFQDRCEHCSERCRKEHPTLIDLEEGHQVACHMFA
ncbi:MAG: peptide ABC transporter ATP-binding protein, partial [Eubacterium sp.]|nr:peptide ABC transporter ATP-binding protein [Eubacterium sp.]